MGSSRARRTAYQAKSRSAASKTETDQLSGSPLRRLGVAIVCAKLILVPLVFDQSLDWPFTVSKVLLSHGLAYVLAGLLGALLIRFGRSFVLWSPLHAPVLAFLAANAAATVFAVNTQLALYGTHTRMLGLGTIADWCLLYMAIALLVRTRTECVLMFASALGASVVVLLYAFVQDVGRDPFRWAAGGEVRPFSTLGQATSLGHYLSTLASGTFALAVAATTMRWPLRFVLLGYSALLVLGAGATGTRAALIGLAIGSAVLVIMIWILHPGRRARLISLSATGVAAAAFAALVVFSPVGQRLAATITTSVVDGDTSLGHLDLAADTRLSLYGIAARMLEERPILGYGPDNFAVGVPTYRAEHAPIEIRQVAATSPHSWVASVAIGAGVLGLISFVAIAVVAGTLVFRSGFDPLTITSAVVIAAFLGTGLTTIDEISVNSLFWAGAGVIASVTAMKTSAKGTMPRRPNRGRPGSRDGTRTLAAAACLVAGLVLGLLSTRALEASRSARLSEDLRHAGRHADAIEVALEATRLDTQRPEYWHKLGLAYVGAGRWREAGSAFERATRLAPYDVRYVRDQATANLLLASTDSAAQTRAVELADRAVRIDPNNPAAHLTRAAVMQATGTFTEAFKSAERALELDAPSNDARLYVTAVQAAIGAGRAIEAVRIAQQGLPRLSTPDSVQLRYELARALVASGQPDHAVNELVALLAIRPDYAPAQRLLSELRAGAR